MDHPPPTPADPAASTAGGVLAEITANLASGNDLHELLGRFLHTVLRMTGAGAGAVRVLDTPTQRMLLVSDVGLPGQVLDAERSVEQDCGACGAASLGDRPVWADDLSACSRRSGGQYFGSGCRRMLAVPLQHRGRVLGVYNLFFDAGHRPGVEVLALLKSIGDLLGLALNNARLEQEHLQATLRQERQMMAAEVHDSIAQALAFVKMRLPLLHDAMLAHDDDRALKYYEDVRGTVGEAHTSLRRILADFRTAVDPRGFVHALRTLADSFRERSGIALDLEDRVGHLALDEERQAQAFHVVQEALSNVARHSGAGRARVVVEQQAGALRVRVEDDGTGMAVDAAGGMAAHYGIDIMKARARRLDGTLELSARGGGGTCVQLSFPLQPPGRDSRRAAEP